MRARVPLFLALALVATGSVAAAARMPRLVQVVKRDGAVAATLTYRANRDFTYRPTLAVRQGGRLVLVRRLCPLDFTGRGTCTWVGPGTWSLMRHGRIAFRHVAPTAARAVVLDLWAGGAHCCEESFIALLGPRPDWIAHDWGDPGYRGRRIDGRYYFVSGDDRFAYAFAAYAFSWFPPQIWTIREGRLVDVTRTLPALVAANARRAWRRYRKPGPEAGVLAGWCADEYLLGRGPRCERVLARVRDRRFVRRLHRDLQRWGYERR